MAFMSKTTRILDSMIGRRTNDDILRMASLYLGTRINNEEYEYLLERMIHNGIEGCSEAHIETSDFNPIRYTSKPVHRFRKNKQGQSRGKPKHKR